MCTDTTARLEVARRERIRRPRLRGSLEQTNEGVCIFRSPNLIYKLANKLRRRVVRRKVWLGKPLLEAMPELRKQRFSGREFLATASHELRTPLNAILSWASLLGGGRLDANGYRHGVETIERNARAQVRIIEDILDRSRIITGKLQLELLSLDMVQLVRAALDAVRPTAQTKGIVLTVDLGPAAVQVTGDPERLQQVVWSLANNAIKFTPSGGTVHVQLRRIGATIELRVADSGQGIDVEFLPHLFERFRQGEGSTTRRSGGLGLGLALVRHLVEAHGGTVGSESAGPGRGATFRVNLPVRAALAECTPATSERAFRAGATFCGISVLVVDDEDGARDLVADVLRAAGADVTTAPSAKRALVLLTQTTPTILISGIDEPDFDGYELIRLVRSLRPSIDEAASIDLAAQAQVEDGRCALEADFRAQVAKPVQASELVCAVARVTQTASAAPIISI